MRLLGPTLFAAVAAYGCHAPDPGAPQRGGAKPYWLADASERLGACLASVEDGGFGLGVFRTTDDHIVTLCVYGDGVVSPHGSFGWSDVSFDPQGGEDSPTVDLNYPRLGSPPPATLANAEYFDFLLPVTYLDTIRVDYRVSIVLDGREETRCGSLEFPTPRR